MFIKGTDQQQQQHHSRHLEESISEIKQIMTQILYTQSSETVLTAITERQRTQAGLLIHRRVEINL